MAKKLVKKQDGGASNKAQRVINRTTNKINRLENRANKAETKAIKAYDNYNSPSVSSDSKGYWENRTLAQGEKAQRLRERAEDVRVKRSKYTGEKTKNVRLAEQEFKKGGAVKSKKK